MEGRKNISKKLPREAKKMSPHPNGYRDHLWVNEKRKSNNRFQRGFIQRTANSLISTGAILR